MPEGEGEYEEGASGISAASGTKMGWGGGASGRRAGVRERRSLGWISSLGRFGGRRLVCESLPL